MEKNTSLNRIDISINSLNDYDWSGVSNFLKKKNPIFIAGRPLQKDDYGDKQTQPLAGAIDQLNYEIAESQIVVLTSAKRMGSTTVGVSWVDENPKKRKQISITSWPPKEYKHMFGRVKAKEIFIDEFTGGNNEMFDAVEHIAKNQGKKVVLRVFLDGADKIENELKARSLTFSEVRISPVPRDQMLGYLGNRLNQSVEDPLISVIADASGGSLLLANHICENLSMRIRYSDVSMSPGELRKILEQSFDDMGEGVIGEWNKDKEKTPDRLRECYPTPLLEDFGL